MKRPHFLLILLALALFSSSVWAHDIFATGVSLPWWTVDGGGAISTGGVYTVRGAAGQPDAGVMLTSGAYTLNGGFWQALSERIRALFLPLVLRDFSTLAAPCGPDNSYCEDYESWENPYGPLDFDTAYQAYPEDGTDYYFFDLSTTRTVTVLVQNYQATGQLILYRHREDDTPDFVANYGGGGTTMTIGPLPLDANRYYVRVETESDSYNTDELYTLTVTLD